MSQQLYRLISAEWDDQPEVHPVWETRTLTGIEQFEEWTATKKTNATERLLPNRPVSPQHVTPETP